MTRLLLILFLGLFRLVIAQDTHVVKITEPSYLYNGNIGPETGPGSTWQLDLFPDAQRVEVNGDVNLTDFIVLSNPGVSSIDFEYHGGSVNVVDSMTINSTAASGPLKAIITGDKYFTTFGSLGVVGNPNQKNTLYVDFSEFSAGTFAVNYVTATIHSNNFYVNVFGVTSGTAIFESDIKTNSVLVNNGVAWFDGKISVDAYSFLPILQEHFDSAVENNSPAIVVINDTVPGQINQIGPSFFDTPNTYYAFVTKINKISYGGEDTVKHTKSWIAQTEAGNFSFVFDSSTSLNTSNFGIEDITVNKNGTDYVVHAIKYVDEAIPPPITNTVTKSTTTDTEVISFFPTVGSDGKTHTGSTTYTLVDTDTYSQPSESTAYVTKDSTTETDVISYFPTVGSDGKTHTGSTTYTLVDTDTYSQPSESTAYVTKDSTTETDVISYFPTVGSDGKTHTGSTTYTLADSSSKDDFSSMAKSSSKIEPSSKVESSSTTDTAVYSQPPATTATVDLSSTTVTEEISFFPTVGTDGKTHTGSTTYTLSDNTTSMSKSVTPLPASTILETDIVSDNQTIHEVVIASGYTDSEGHIATTTWTELTMNMVDVHPVFTSSSMMPFANSSTTTGDDYYTQPPITTTTVTVNDTTETIVITYCPIVGSDGKTHTSTSKSTVCDSDMYTQPPVTTATVSKEGGVAETVVVSCYPSVGTDGKTHTGSSVSTLNNVAKPTSGMTSGSNTGTSSSNTGASSSNTGASGSSGTSGSSGSSGSNSGINGSNAGSNSGSNAGSNSRSHGSNGASSSTHSTSSTSGVALQSNLPHATVNSVQYEASGSTTINNILFAAMMVVLHFV
ncbi:hypothetical protein RNJ44_00105 [Nakaseomyces bracarensis]|uniref:Hyphally-regulated cell wall protein N-terminal domain-containing protein n=1 Tax=Nakaseomyces bracarensis TaxID=273131 RepID=A0ABR4P1P3_9SACH